MKKYLFVLVALLTLLCFAFPATADVTWKLTGNKDGIQYYAGDVPGTPFQQFKGTAVINAPIEVVGEVIRDVPSYTQWMYECTENKL
ncbi:MAG: hypothetical protein PHY31_08090, partial [Smithellaceae bacterium]|nr:hypothetical protein [Smithellaceae bacterium]